MSNVMESHEFCEHHALQEASKLAPCRHCLEAAGHNNVMKCSHCKDVLHCCKDCQLSDWPRRCKECKMWAEMKQEARSKRAREQESKWGESQKNSDERR